MSTQVSAAPAAWRRYWQITLPVILSVYLSLALGYLLLADLVLHGEYGAVGGLLTWAAISIWQARPGGAAKLAALAASRRHVPGTWSVQRPGTRAVPTDAGAQGQGRRAPSAVAAAVLVILLDVAVTATIAVTRAWPVWTLVMAVALLVAHLSLTWRLAVVTSGSGRVLGEAVEYIQR